MVLPWSVSAFDELSLVSSGCLSWTSGGATAGRSASGGRSGQPAAAITGVEETMVVVGACAAGWAVTGGKVTTAPGTAEARVGCLGLLVGARADGSAQAHSSTAHSSARSSRAIDLPGELSYILQ